MKKANYRIFVEKKANFQVEANSLQTELNTNLHLSITNLRLINIYDIFDISDELLKISINKIFSEPVTDNVNFEVQNLGKYHFAIEFLQGQFDQRADSATQCLSLLDSSSKVKVKSAKLISLEGKISDYDFEKIKKYCINDLESKEKNLSILDDSENIQHIDIEYYNGFITFDKTKLEKMKVENGFAMSIEDLIFIQDYFKNEEKRDPSETEIKVLDTYWSDHCRHTTFETIIENITFEKSNFDSQLQEAFLCYLAMRKRVHGGQKPISLMDMATICGKYERIEGNLEELEVSDEINACSIYIDVEIDGKKEPWLLMFKNETHNHPTEIEPFGGASTCIGGAIRDPLSGRSYVYQAMRITGAGDITEPVENSIEGKLPQQIISKSAAQGYSSYGNQIGLATTYVREIYHDGYKAKRMEIGVVVGAAPLTNVKREAPKPGDMVIMFGGKTGRDGIGGATGSSKEHNENSLEICAAEVQKGNAPEERKIQHLFRRPEVTKLIKRSNDFGAGGISVAIGELADGLVINLDNVPVKYKGLNGTELAISESQERMSAVIDKNNVTKFLNYCAEENIEATVIATVTDKNRLQMYWKEKMIVDISRDFINTNGIKQKISITVDVAESEIMEPQIRQTNDLKKDTLTMLSGLNVASQKGLTEMFDSHIGATTVLSPFGGKYQQTESQVSVQKLPVLKGETDDASILSFGYNPYISSKSPFHGAMYAIIESISKIVAAGADYHSIKFTFQEYFEKLGKDPLKWGKPFAALLGAIKMQYAFHLPSIGGKDSMSGTFKTLNVPPTLVSFAITTTKASQIISPEFKNKDNYIYLIKHNPVDLMPNVEELKSNFDNILSNIENQNIVSAFAIQYGGIMEALCKMSFGNDLGFNINYIDSHLFDYSYGSIIVESTACLDFKNAILLGKVDSKFSANSVDLDKTLCFSAWKSTFASIYPDTVNPVFNEPIPKLDITKKEFVLKPKVKIEKVKVLLPVFPGTNCDYDTAKAFEKEGAETNIFIFRNQNEQDINSSIDEMAKLIDNSHILVISGGFSAGDEPDGSGKFIAAVLNNCKIKDAINRLLDKNFLILGICNGFQALVKSGLLPFGKIGKITTKSPTLYRNDINRHVANITKTVVSSNWSPWLSSFNTGDIHSVPVSHGEGKFVVNKTIAKQLFNNHQIAFQYCNFAGIPSMKADHNPNGSFYAIEGIVSENGLILGKMGHSERKGNNLYKNISGNKEQNIFSNAIAYLLQ